MKLDKRFAGPLNALIMAIVLPFFMTLVISIINIGFTDRLLNAWMKTWGIASIAAFPLILILSPPIKKLVMKLTA
ncbi:MAG: DUF2798 domain-containing protein [Treponemataceae bacterium]